MIKKHIVLNWLVCLAFIFSFSLSSQPKPALKMAFGSCSHQDKKQKLWDDVILEKPDLWIWLGDNVYGDTENMALLQSKYRKQHSDSLYQILLKNCPITGTWDDHDYGENDGGKTYPKKDSSQQLLLDFLDVPALDPRRTQKGVYTCQDIYRNGLKVRLLLLDTRYFRDDLKKINGKCVPKDTGTILGDEQWKWLEEKLKSSVADVNLIVSSIQVLPEEHNYEKWANFPLERERLLNLIVSSGAQSPILLSGDRHIAEISEIQWKGKKIFEITSSSLTHGWKTKSPEANKYRKGALVYEENFGLLEIKAENGIKIKVSILSDNRITETSLQIQ
ncbi:MAG: alkaline phosphatase family protein [Bacteroidia bacterium]|nr:alkaline phosphatase family protein [Bacteroidia bacterium]